MKQPKGNRNTRLALLALGLFVLFDVVGVSLNYLLSWRLEQQAIGINLAGRQRMLSQRMVKVLLQIDEAKRNGEPTKVYYDELKLTFDLFDNTLQGFHSGHETLGGSGETLFLAAVTAPKAAQAVADAVTLWRVYRGKVVTLINHGEQSDETSLQAALTEARTTNLKLLSLMNTLTTELERLTQTEAQRIRVYQAVVLVLALACFAWSFVLFRRSNAEALLAWQQAADAARAEQNHVADQVARTITQLQMAEDMPTLAHHLFASLAPTLGIGSASFYRFDENSRMLVAIGQYAQEGDLSLAQQIPIDQGLIGECAQARQLRVIRNPVGDITHPQTALMQAQAVTLVLMPLVNNDRLLGLIEMALLRALDARNEEILNNLLPMLAMRLQLLGRSIHQHTRKD